MRSFSSRVSTTPPLQQSRACSSKVAVDPHLKQMAGSPPLQQSPAAAAEAPAEVAERVRDPLDIPSYRPDNLDK